MALVERNRTVGRRGWWAGALAACLCAACAPAAGAPGPDEPNAPPAAEAATQPAAAAGTTGRWLEEVVVTATRRPTLLANAPGVVQVVTRREIEELNPTSTGELLEYVTGVTVETGTGSGLSKRSVIGLNGLPANYTLVLVDGVRLLSEHIHTGQNVELIPPQSIERIEIIRGAAAAQYGSDAIGGVVNIITRKCGDNLELSLNGAGGRYGSSEGGFGVLAPFGSKVRTTVFMNREESEGIPLKLPAHRVGKTGFQRHNTLARIDADVTETTKVFGWLNMVCNKMDWQDGEEDARLIMPVLGTTVQLAPRLSLFAQTSYSQWDTDVSNERNELVQPEFRLTWQISDAHTLTGGMDMKYHRFTRSAAEEAPSQNTYGLFVQHEWLLTKKLTLMGALRYDCVENIDSVITPHLSLVYSPESWLRLRGSVSRGFHAPTPQELYERGYGHGGRALRFGNEDLDPEHSTTYTAGIELLPGEPLEVMLVGYYSDVDDMIVPVFEGPWDEKPAFDVWRRTNIEEVKVYGGEIKARYTFSPHIRVEAGYDCTSTEEGETGRQLPFNAGQAAFAKLIVGGKIGPDWKLSGFVGVRQAFDRASWNWKPPAGAPRGDASGLTTTLRDHQKLDAGLSVEYKDTYTVYAKVDNILGQDIENLDDAFTVIDGRPVLTVGFRAKW